MRRAVLVWVVVGLLLPYAAAAASVAQTTSDNSSSNDMHAVIEADLRAQGVDRAMSASKFRLMVDALASSTQKQGITPATVSANARAQSLTSAPPLALTNTSSERFSAAVLDAQGETRAASQEESAIIVAGIAALILLVGIWRKYRQSTAAKNVRLQPSAIKNYT